jgi:hypothetical protein
MNYNILRICLDDSECVFNNWQERKIGKYCDHVNNGFFIVLFLFLFILCRFSKFRYIILHICLNVCRYFAFSLQALKELKIHRKQYIHFCFYLQWMQVRGFTLLHSAGELRIYSVIRVRVRVRVTLRLAVYRQSVRLCD